MKTTECTINGIPALLWGESSEKLFVAVHGNMSHKADTVIGLFAQTAAQKGYQTLSFDLPEHGDRKGDGAPCKVQNCIAELLTVMNYAKNCWNRISLFGCSMGAYFSLLAFEKERLEQCLFLSPVVDMEFLIEQMMTSFSITPEQLKKQQEIPTPVGQTLYWDYYCYVKSHPLRRWTAPTAILRGERDDLCSKESITAFSERFDCRISVVPDGEHFFHTPEQLAAYENWLEQQIL